MARKLSEIQASLDQSITEVIERPSSSAYAEWKLWRSIFARAVWIFESILDSFKTEIQNTISNKQPGTFEWYYEKILQFQGSTDGQGACQGDDLVIINGILTYQNIDVSRRIVTKASIAAADGILAVKVAKDSGTPGDYQELTASERLAFSLYLDNIKYPGTAVTVTSIAPDKISYNWQIVYDPVYSQTTVWNNVKAALEEYRAALGFDSVIYPAKMMEAALKATGVVSIMNNGVKAWSVTAGVYAPIDIKYSLVAGYYNYDFTQINAVFINYKTL